MPETKKTERSSKLDSIQDDSLKATEAAGRLARACTEAGSELAIGSLRMFSDLFIGVAEGVAENISKAVTDSTDTAQRSADRFFTGLKSDKAKTKAESSIKAE